MGNRGLIGKKSDSIKSGTYDFASDSRLLPERVIKSITYILINKINGLHFNK